MTTTQDKEFAQGRAQILGLLAASAKQGSTCPEIVGIVTAHVTAKHKLTSFPAFLGSPDIGDEDKLATIMEIAGGLFRHLQKQPHGLLGTVPGGQAHQANTIDVTPKRTPTQLPPPLPATAYVKPGGRVTPSGDPPKMSEADMKRVLADADGCKVNESERVVVFDNPPPGGWKPEDKVPAHLQNAGDAARFYQKEREKPKESVIHGPDDQVSTPLTEALRRFIGEVSPSANGGVTEERVREIIDEKLAALRVDMELYALKATDDMLAKFKAHIARFDPATASLENPGEKKAA